MLLLNRSNCEKLILNTVALVGLGIAPAAAQQACSPCAAGQAGQSAPSVQSDRLDNGTLFSRGIYLGVGGAGAAYGAAKVGGAAQSVVNVGQVSDVPHYGKFAVGLPVVGKMVKNGHLIPTTLGQVPVMGHVVNHIPVVGPVVAGPANPVIVGAVAIDTYVIPKYSPCGYTKSSVVAATNDFNSPPKLRGYVNYLAPMPYTHPPIYSPSTQETDLPADLAYIDAIPASSLSNEVTLPSL